MNIKRWFRSRRGKNVIIAVLSLALALAIVGHLARWGDLGGLVAGTAVQQAEAYACMPTCVEDDGKFLAMPGDELAAFGGTRIALWIEVPEGRDRFELGIFDGDAGKDDAGKINVQGGNWDDTAVETTYTLYADSARDGSGDLVVGEWKGNADPMPNNGWYDLTIENVVEARNLNGAYYYRLEATRPAEGAGINGFKLRSTGRLSAGRSDLVDANLPIVGMMATAQDEAILYPEFSGDRDDPGPSTYDGEWTFHFHVPAGAKTLTFWDGDFDRGTEAGVDGDTDDLNTVGRPGWALAAAVDERAGGQGAPADDAAWAMYRREPAVRYEIVGPQGQPVFANPEPSGSEEWERFVVSSDPNLPDEELDLRVDQIPPGTYTLRVTGLDLHNTVWLRTNYAIGEETAPPCPLCPECPPCPCQVAPPVPAPTPTPTPGPEPMPEPQSCDDAAPVDVLYVLDTSGSMAQLYPGAGSKLEAAQDAMRTLNAQVADEGNGSRVALLAFHGDDQGQGDPALYPPDLQLISTFTPDVEGFNRQLQALEASGSAPLAHALDMVAERLFDRLEPGHAPLVILISDGVPTVDLDQHGFAEAFVEEVSLYDGGQTFLSPDQVRGKGASFPEYGERAGEPLADVMEAIRRVKAAAPGARVHAVALQAVHQGVFNDDVLQYVAAEGDGAFHAAEDADQLAQALRRAFVDAACGEAPPGPEPTPETEPTPEPEPTDEPGCENPRVNQYDVEVIERPSNGIWFEYRSGTEVRDGAFDAFRFTVTAREAAAMNQVRFVISAGGRGGRVDLRGCQFDGAAPCDPVSSGDFTVTFRGAEDNGDGTMTLTFRVQNAYRRGLSNVLVTLPRGVTPSWPTGSYESRVCPEK